MLSPGLSSVWISAIVVTGVSLAVAVLMQAQRKRSEDDEIRVAFLGNAMLYYNDAPRLLEQMLRMRFSKVIQDSCLRGGSSLVTLWEKGNGVAEEFASSEAQQRDDGSYDIGAPTVTQLLKDEEWDAVVLNDFTQAPARVDSREATKEVLQDKYLPLLKNSKVVFVQTPAYRLVNIRGTEDLGNFTEFTRSLEDGYNEFVGLFSEASSCGCDPCLAPVGAAYALLREKNRSLWEKLYCQDGFHPSPHGTWLMACILYGSIVGHIPPVYHKRYFLSCRYMAQSPEEAPLPLPTKKEAQELRWLACEVCDIAHTGLLAP